jgi:hypothetical protein
VTHVLKDLRWELNGRSSTEKGDKVSFHVGDVFLPNAEELPVRWGDGDELEGTIVDFSDSGSTSRVFAVIEVVQRQTVVVPVEKLKLKGPGARNQM